MSGVYCAISGSRTIERVKPSSRERCHCGCKGRATHRMLADGCCMGTGCELNARRWQKDPVNSYRAMFRNAPTAEGAANV